MESASGISGDARQSGFVRTALEATNAQLKARIRELSDDLEFLRAARGKVSSDTAQFVSYATTELRAKDDQINELRAQLREISYSKDVEARKVRAQMENAFDEAVSEHRQVEAQLREALRAAEYRLQRAQQYLERREELENRVEELQALLESERAAHKEAFLGLERKYLLERSVLVKSHEAAFGEMRRQARAEAIRALDADTKRVLVRASSAGNVAYRCSALLLRTGTRPAADREPPDGRRAEAPGGRDKGEWGYNVRVCSKSAYHIPPPAPPPLQVLSKERLALSEQARLLTREVELKADMEVEWARQVRWEGGCMGRGGGCL